MSDFPLFEVYPELGKSISRMKLADYPTPVEPMDKMGRSMDLRSLWIKRDDMDSGVFSGNKIRVMELLLGEAKRRGCDLLISMGALGSNQILSSVIFGRGAGFDIEGLYFKQPLHGYVKRHMLVGSKYGAKMIYSPSPGLTPLLAAYRWMRGKLAGRKPFFIPTFGSHPLCVLGYVNAGIEFVNQVRDGQCPMPDVVYVTLGTGGTYSGILLAFRLMGFNAKVVGVRITDKIVCNEFIIANLLNRTLAFMRKNGASVPDIRFKMADLCCEHDFFGPEYAGSTPEAEEAIRMVSEKTGLMLDTTYTAKTFAALADHAKRGKLRAQNVLYWHTLNGVDLRPAIEGITPECLPDRLKEYACECGDDSCDLIGF